MNKIQIYKRFDLGTPMAFITVGYQYLMHINKLIFTYKKTGEYNYLGLQVKREKLKGFAKGHERTL